MLNKKYLSPLLLFYVFIITKHTFKYKYFLNQKIFYVLLNFRGYKNICRNKLSAKTRRISGKKTSDILSAQHVGRSPSIHPSVWFHVNILTTNHEFDRFKQQNKQHMTLRRILHQTLRSFFHFNRTNPHYDQPHAATL